MVADYKIPADNILKIFPVDVWITIFATLHIVALFVIGTGYVGRKIGTPLTSSGVLLFPLK